jgi:predicted nucleic acid-binding Zn finger protein
MTLVYLSKSYIYLSHDLNYILEQADYVACSFYNSK